MPGYDLRKLKNKVMFQGITFIAGLEIAGNIKEFNNESTL